MLMFRVAVTVAAVCMAMAYDDVRSLRAVRNYDARLPCGFGKIFLDGPDAYVLWLKDDEKFLYRFPNEDTWQKTLNPNNIYGTSCVGSHCYDDTSLFLPQVTDKDEGKYRCRVHYQGSSSVDYVIDLKIVDPTGVPRVYNEKGEQITTPYIGPLTLGSNITLVCEVVVSQAPTTVLWYRNGIVVKRVSTDTPGILREHVVISEARRDELDAQYQCTASNADVTEPFSATVVVKMYLPPLKVEIRLNNNFDFEVGQPRVVDCVVIGCVPTPTINWYLGGTLVKSTAHKELHDGNYTVSSLTLTASIQDNLRQLSCRVHNAYLQTIYEDNVTLHVGYRPRCTFTKEQTVGIVNGEAETIMCLVESAPAPVQFTWVFPDSRILYTSATRVNGRKNQYCSSLTWIPQNEDLGLLYCRAVNMYGEQRLPCVYSLTLGGTPQPPNCDVEGSDDKKKIVCQKGWDGGRTQTVHLEVLTLDGVVVHNTTDPCGNFSIPAMDQNVTATVYSSNVRGKSAESTIDLNSVISADSTPASNSKAGFSWGSFVFVTSSAGAVLAACIGFCLCCRLLWRKPGSTVEMDRQRGDGLFHREPDVTRDERPASTTINVHQHATCQNVRPVQYKLPDVQDGTLRCNIITQADSWSSKCTPHTKYGCHRTGSTLTTQEMYV
ncbi:unnamed protein product [Chilo suppressalis]|uniref:Ig-like domain-containing protein n=1 Tax=Chilo suppressalis TaxID=168631 RepID=A0ABN8L9Z1_CHISP|nr:unnamed protein product [Chilo suppressalis]